MMYSPHVGRYVLALVLALISHASAQVPSQINYQGRLTTSEGTRLDTVVDLTFGIYEDEGGSSLMWTETHPGVFVKNGLFSCVLGGTSPFPEQLWTGPVRYLGTSIGNGLPLSPLLPMVSVAYALRSGSAGTADIAGFTAMAADAAHAAEADLAAVAGRSAYADTAGYALAAPGGGFALPYFGEIDSSIVAFSASNAGTGTAIRGQSRGDNGVVGYTNAAGKSGVYGYSSVGNGIAGRCDGDAYGGYFEATGAGGYGLYANGQQCEGAALLEGDLIMSRGQIRGGAKLGPSALFRSDTLTHGDTGVVFATYRGPATYGGDLTAVSGISATSDSSGRGGYFRGGWIGAETEVYPYGERSFYGLLSSVWGGSNPSSLARNTAIYARSRGNNNNVNWGLQVDTKGAEFNYGIDIDVDNEVFITSRANYGIHSDVARAARNYGVYAWAGDGSSDSLNCGVYGYANGGDIARGGHFHAFGSTYKYGVYAEAEGTGSNFAVYAVAPVNLTSYAGLFDGDVGITGTLYGGTSAVRIDHPLDPENRYLIHSAVASSELKNVYDGTVVLDDDGRATVSLPDYVEALNHEFRYQLTCVGGYAPVYIAQKVADHSFVIAGGSPFLEVCWQVTGVRRDPAAMARPMQVEIDKPLPEKGTYLDPAAYGLSKESGVYHAQKQAVGSERERSQRQHELVGNDAGTVRR